MHRIITSVVVFVVLLLAACGTAEPSAGDASMLGDRDLEATLVRPTIAPVLESAVPPVPSRDGDSIGELPAAAIVAGVADAPPVVKLIEDLRHRGIEPTPSGESRADFLADAPGQAYRIGAGWLYLHPLPSAEIANAKRTDVQRVLDHPMGDWVAPPHAYQCSQTIVLYLGTDEQVIKALTELCGAQFAGRQ